uniref:Retrovirus-related Pol polyprotein from transposon TNT 1-94 n=1 Tax=Tanacetum cinerariifolium TaxID=118510 RepID=A0A699H8P6_TANCI|nr:retrovirus-related Pol polyprotein from transposon TNT 1-94 [Tanacetum cinerariifolium]
MLGIPCFTKVTKETTAVGIWMKLTSLYMTKSLANRLYLKKKLYTYYMSLGMKLGDHIDEFNKLILDLANIDIKIEDKDQALMLLTSLSSSYENFMETLLYGRESLTMEDVLATLNLRELKKRTEGTKEETDDGLYVKGRSDHSVTPTLEKPLVGNDEMIELVMDVRGSYHMTHRRDFLYDFKVVDGGLKISLISLGTLEKEGYTVKMRMGRIKVIKGYWVMMTGIRKKNCVYTLEAKVMTFGVQKHEGSKQVRLKQLGSKQVWFKQPGHKQVGFKQLGPDVKTGVHGVQDVKRVWFEVELQGAQGDREAEVFQVSNDDAAAQRRLEDKQLEEKTNTYCLVKEQEKVHLGIKVGQT